MLRGYCVNVRRGAVLMMLLGAAAVGVAETPDPRRLAYATSGKWYVQFNEASCVASQEYAALDPATPDPKMMLLFKYSPSGNVLGLFIHRTVKRKGETDQRDVALQFDQRVDVPLSSLRYSNSDKGERWTIDQINLGPGAIEQLRHAHSLTAKMGGAARVYPLLAMERVMATLEKCRQSLNIYWNIDSAIARMEGSDPSRKRKPGPMPPPQPGTPPVAITPPNELFSSDDYPAAAVIAGQSGTTSAEVLINEKGEVKECFVNETSGVATLDVMTCLKMFKAKYHPALDASGKAVRSYDDIRIKWVSG